jgi:hypothetical protein
MVEKADAQHDVEAAIPLFGKVSHVIAVELQTLQLEQVFHEPGTHKRFFPALDAHHRGALTCELDGE